MRTALLRELLRQYDDNSVPFVRIGIGTANRINHATAEGAQFDPDLFEVKGVDRDEKTGAPVILLEARE